MTNDATPNQDSGSLTFEQVLQKTTICVKQLIVLEMIDAAAKLIEEAGTRGEDCRPLLKILADYAEAEVQRYS